MKINDELLEYIIGMEIIDTHEHLPSNEEDRDRNTDVLKEYLTHYFSRDLISAGLSKEEYQNVMETKMPIVEKWKLVEPFWEVSKYTGYGRCLEISVKELYGIEEISGNTIEELNQKFLQTLNEGHFRKVLKEKSRIKTSLLCVNTLEKKYDLTNERSIYCDRDLFVPVYVIGHLIYPLSWQEVEKIEREADLRISSFSNWLEATEALIEKAAKLGADILKNHLAYMRNLRYERVSRSKAEEDFNNIFKTKHLPEWGERPLQTGKHFQDYMFHFILDIANKKNQVVQIHTGMQEGSGNILSNSNPEHLINLFLEYPQVKFDIFHISYPYQNVLTVLAKSFPNVFIDMCWAHIMSPNASISSLLEWIDTVPLNKISAFGGDYVFIDGVYGHQHLARINVAQALSIKVEDGLIDTDTAKELAKMFLYDNPKRIFGLE